MRRMITGKQIEKVENAPEILNNGQSYEVLIRQDGTDEVLKICIGNYEGEPRIWGENDGTQTQGLAFGKAEDGDPNMSIDDVGVWIWNLLTSSITGQDGITINPDPNQVDTYLVINNLPTSDPRVAGAVWNDNGTLKISSGS